MENIATLHTMFTDGNGKNLLVSDHIIL